MFLLEDAPESRTPVSIREPHFPVFAEFRDASYVKRYELLCRKMVLERHYTAACFLVADRKMGNRRDNYIEPAEDLSARVFLAELLRHIIRR